MTAGTKKEKAEQLVSAAPKVQSYLEGRQIRKVIVVPERLVNNNLDHGSSPG
jgi:leucyl-tRNA synthetase